MFVLCRWYEEEGKNPAFVPKVEGLLSTTWYTAFVKIGPAKAETMWTQHHIYHAYKVGAHLYTRLSLE